MDILEQIKNYRPWNEQERQDQAVMLAFLEKNPRFKSRPHAAHGLSLKDM